MVHIASIGAGMYSDLAVAVADTTPVFANLDTAGEFEALFAAEILSYPAGTPATGTFVRILNVREFPSMGTPPNIVNVPVYGQATSQQIQGQSDAPSIEVTLNYIPQDWARPGSLLGPLVGNAQTYAFRFALLNTKPTGATAATKFASLAGPTGIGAVPNSSWYWYGKIEALQVNPQLTDSNTATVTMSIQSDFFGAFTLAAS